MPTEDDATPGPADPGGAPDPGAGSDPPGDPAADHDASGLDLAALIAHAARGRRPGTKRKAARPARRSGPVYADDREPKPVGEALDRLTEERGWRLQVSIHTLLARWAALVGPVNADHSQPEAYADGVLTIRAESTAWAAQLRLIAPNLVAQLNERLGDGAVTRVVVLGPDVPSWKHGRRSVRDGRGPRDTYG